MSFGNVAATNKEVIWTIGLRRNGRSASGIKGDAGRIKYMELPRNPMAVKSNGVSANFGHLPFCVSAGMTIFHIHSRHKLEGWMAFLHQGTAWTRVKKLAGIRLFTSLATAVAATLMQLVCFTVHHHWSSTRISASLPTCALIVAIPCTLSVVTLAFIEGGEFFWMLRCFHRPGI